ncbi:MAG: ABC transporter permease [Phycisphaeraceae bacterium]
MTATGIKTLHQQPSIPAEAGPIALWTRATLALAWRELTRFSRQRTRIIGALATPVIFWILLGSGLNNVLTIGETTALTSPLSDPTTHGGGGVGYLAYFFVGTVLMIVLFTAIFSMITVIEDRREGFLQGVLVSPAPGSAVAAGKMLGAATIATLQGGLFLLAWPFVLGPIAITWWLASLAVIGLIALGLAGLGLLLAWPMNSTAGFHALMNVLLMPMWFLSGAVFPLDVAPLWLRLLGYINPLTYGHTLLSYTMFEGAPPAPLVPVWLAALLLLVSVSAALFFAARAVRGGR